MELSGHVALVTGAGSGIGRATALRLSREGAAVVVDDVDAASGQDAVREIERGGGRAAFVRADVSDEAEVQAMVACAEENFGGLDVLVNNAGHYISAPYYPHAEPQRWGRVLDVYLRGVLLVTHYAVRAMQKRGGGAIVNISSAAGIGWRPHEAPEYAAAKAGVARLTAAFGSLAHERGIRVNCICPGWVHTPASQRTLAEMTPEERKAAPSPSAMLQPEEVADAVIELLRNDALAGRVMLYLRPGERRLVPIEGDG